MGEIRGGEAFDLLQLLNAGSSGTIQPRTLIQRRKAFRDLPLVVKDAWDGQRKRTGKLISGLK